MNETKKTADESLFTTIQESIERLRRLTEECDGPEKLDLHRTEERHKKS